jgi:predicted amidophosphoribosyltransferase
MPVYPISPISLQLDYPLTFDGSWHLVYYIPRRKLTDPFCISLIKFKENNVVIVQKWINAAVPRIKALNIKFDYVVRALRSKELEASGNEGLDKLGESLEKNIDTKYLPLGLKKTRATKPMHEITTKQGRYDELKGVYYIPDDAKFEDGKSFLILDDINTSGATIVTIRHVIQEKYPNSKIYFFTLGRTSYDTAINSTFDTNF